MTGRFLNHQRALSTSALCFVGLAVLSLQPALAQTLHTIQIANDADDGYYNSENGTGWHSTPENGNADWVGSSGGLATAWVIGYRFPSTGINSGDTIQSAYLELVSSDTDAAQTTCGSAPCAATNSTFRIYGVAQNDGPSFSGVTGNTPLDVPYTTSYTDYTTTGPGDDHGSCQGENNGQSTCTHIIDVTSIVREITSRSGWTNTSAIRFVLLSTDPSASNIYAGFEDSSANAARAATLVVNPPTPTIVSSGGWGSPAGTYYTTVATGPFVYPGASTLLLFLGDYYQFNNSTIGQPTVSDNCGNSWQILEGPSTWAGQVYDMRSTVYYVQNPASCPAGATITVTMDNEEPIYLHFVAVAGSDIPLSSTINSPSPGTYTSAASTNPITLSSSGLLVSWIFGDADPPNNGTSDFYIFTPEAGYATDLNSIPNYLTAVSESVSSGGSYLAQYSISGGANGTDGWQDALVGLQAPAAGPPVITSAGTAGATTAAAFSYQIEATNSPTSYGATGLPNGLSISAAGLISGTPTQAGTFSVTLSATNGYGTGTAPLTLTVTSQTMPTISWPAPANIPYGTPLSATQLNATASVAGTFTYTPAAGAVLSAGTQILSVTFTPTDTTDYTTATQTAQLVVSQAVPAITWPTPAAITYGTPLTSNQLDATASALGAPSVPGTFTYTPAAGTVLSAGTQTLSVTFTPTDTTDYTTATQTAQLVVNKASQTIDFTLPATVGYGTAPISLTATGGSSGNTVTFSVLSGPGTISGSSLAFTATGVVIVAANQAGNANYVPAPQVTQSVTVNGAVLTATANNASRVYGTANPTFTGTVTGAINGDTFSESFSTTAITTSNVGTYAIVPGVSGANLASYSVAIQNGTLTVAQAGSTTSLSASSGSILAGEGVTLTATVVSATSGTPTGTVTFYDSGVELGTGVLSSGAASFTASSLSAGTTHALTAAYGGDTNFLASSTTASTPVAVATPGFNLTVSGASAQTVAQGSTASYQLTASPVNGSYPGTIGFAASGLPTGATVSFSPSSIAANGGQQTVTATIVTAASAATKVAPVLGRRLVPVSLAVFLLPVLGLRRRRRGFLGRILVVVLFLGAGAAATVLSGCGGDYTVVKQSQAQSYNITITASGGGVQHSVNLTLNVQ